MSARMGRTWMPRKPRRPGAFQAILDTVPPEVSISVGPSAVKLSRQIGKDVTTFTFTVTEDYLEYQLRAVPSETSPVTAGSLLESGGSGSAGVGRDVDVTDDELVAAGLSEGNHVIKVFARDAAGNWSP